MLWRPLLFIIQFLLGSTTQYAIDSNYPPSSSTESTYSITSYGNKLGLNSSQISALYQDHDGFLWIGTTPGISKFDGYHFTNFLKAKNEIIGKIHSILQDSSGIMWVAGVNGLFYFDNGEFHPTNISKNVITTLHKDKDNNIWVGGLDFVPFKLSPAELEKIKYGIEVRPVAITSKHEWVQKLGPLRTWDIESDHKGVIWLGLDYTRASYDGKEINIYWQDRSNIYKYSNIDIVGNDSIFWGSEKIPLQLQYKNQTHTLNDQSTHISYSTDTSLFFLNNTKLFTYNSGKLEIIHSFADNNHYYFRNMIQDREGNFWIGANENLLKLSKRYISKWEYAENPILHSNYSISETNNGALLIGSIKENILQFKNEEIEVYRKISVAHNSVTHDIYSDENGWNWYATSMDGILLERNGSIKKYSEAEGLGNSGQLCFAKFTNGDFWSGGDGTITRITIDKNGHPSFENIFQSVKGSEITEFTNIVEAPKGTLLAVSNNGLYTLKNNSLEKWNYQEDIEPTTPITGVTIDHDNNLWLSTRGEGLWQYKYSADHTTTLLRIWKEADGLISDVILNIHLDKTNKLWIFSQSGACQLNPDNQLINCFNQSDGWSESPTSHTKLLERSDGTMWVVNASTILTFPLYALPTNHVRPNSFITKVALMNGKEDIYRYSDDTTNTNSLPKNLTLPFNKNFIDFHFTGTSLTVPAKNRFKYKLEGIDSDWLLSENNLKVTYSDLKPGKYTFQVYASNNNNVYSLKPAIFTFKILSPWHHRWWAYLSYFLIIATAVSLYFKFKLSKERVENESIRLKELNRVTHRLYNNITHEFRTPLTVIQGMSETIKNSISTKELASVEKALNMIQHNGQKLLNLVNNMLDLTKIENGKMHLQLICSDIIPFIKYSSESFHSYAAQNAIELTIYSEVESIKMDFDPNKIGIILSNLLSNAIKFSRDGDKIIVHINLIKKGALEILFLKIKDTGIGISPQIQPYIFDRFYEAQQTNETKGTGIGLAHTKELVELMKGSITVNSSLGKGSDFIVKIPITRTAPISAGVNDLYQIQLRSLNVRDTIFSEPIIGNNEDNDLELPLILIIEDNKDVAHYLQTCLFGIYRTIYAVNGKEGLDMALDHIPDLIISDIKMPEMDGFEVCKRLKKDQRSDHIPIIILTAKVSDRDRIQGLALGADAYLSKPFLKEELLTRLKQLILARKNLIKRFSVQSLRQETIQASKAPTSEFLNKCISIIHDNINNHSFGTAHLAQKIGLSESQVYRKLKATSGKSTAVYIRSIRLQKAKELIETSNKSISELAYEVGFNDPSWFSRAFKEEFGFPPSDVYK